MASCYTVYSTWWPSLKAKWQLITIIIKSIKLVAITKKNRLAQRYAYSPMSIYISDLKKGH